MDSFEEDDQVEESSPQSVDLPTEQLENALGDLGKGGHWLRGLFLLGCIPGVLNAMHLVAYVFYAQEPIHFCSLRGNNLSHAGAEELFLKNYTKR